MKLNKLIGKQVIRTNPRNLPGSSEGFWDFSFMTYPIEIVDVGKKYIFYQLKEQPHSASKDESKEQHTSEFHFAMVEVQIGNSEMGYTEVTLPLDFDADTNEVVVKNAYAILSKMKNSEEEE